MDRPQHSGRGPGRKRHRRGPRGPSTHPSLVLNEEGVPVATPDAPRPSPVVVVTDGSLERYPWLPRRVIAGSVWRGPGQERVRVDETGDARPWRTRAA